MKVRHSGRQWVRAVDAFALVYRDVATRARLVGRLFSRRDRLDGLLDEDVLAANAEPVTLPEPLIRSKVG